MDRTWRSGRGSLALGLYLVLAVVLFLLDLRLLAAIAAGAALVSVIDLMVLANRSQRSP